MAAARQARDAERVVVNRDQRPLVRRTTALTDAFVAACSKNGIDITGARLPTKREPEWRVTRRDKKRR